MSKQTELAQVADTITVDSGNIGIGTTADQQSSAVNEGIWFSPGSNSSFSANSTPLIINRMGTGGNDRANITLHNNGTARADIGTLGASNGMYVAVGGSEAMRIDSNGVLKINGGSAWNETNQGTGKGSIHLDPNNATSDTGGAITFGASDSGSGETAMSGIYTRSDSAYGTKMYLATTDSYSNGPKTAVKIDQAGRVTTPRQPSFLAALTSNFNTGTSLAKVTGWSVSGNQRYSIGGNFYSNRFTAPVDGRYLFNYTGLQHAGVSGTDAWIRIHYFVNGTSYLDALGDQGTYGAYQRLSVSTIFNLSANDYVEIYASDKNGDSDSGFIYHSYTYFSGHLLG